MTHQVELITPRLILKSVTPRLIHKQFETKTAEEIKQFFGANEKEYERLESMHKQGMETHRYSLFYFQLHDKTDNRVIGECGFHTLNRTHQRAELFYILKNDADKQQGIMKEALGPVLDYAFADMALHRVEALVADWNTASVRLLERYGFTKEGTMREDYVVNDKHENSDCYSLLKWEWERNKKTS